MGNKAHSNIIYNINNTALRSNTVPIYNPYLHQDNAEHFLRLLLTGDAKGLYEADQTPRWGHQPTCFACTEVCGELGRNPALLSTAPASDWVPCSSQGKAEPAPQNGRGLRNGFALCNRRSALQEDHISIESVLCVHHSTLVILTNSTWSADLSLAPAAGLHTGKNHCDLTMHRPGAATAPGIQSGH